MKDAKVTTTGGGMKDITTKTICVCGKKLEDHVTLDLLFCLMQQLDARQTVLEDIESAVKNNFPIYHDREEEEDFPMVSFDAVLSLIRAKKEQLR